MLWTSKSKTILSKVFFLNTILITHSLCSAVSVRDRIKTR